MALVSGGTSAQGWYVCPFCLDRTEVTVAAYAACGLGRQVSCRMPTTGKDTRDVAPVDVQLEAP